MKVLDLQCAHDHGFEGWFASEDDFQSQLDRGLLTCPLCGSAEVRKKLSAPRLNLATPRGESAPAAVVPSGAAQAPQAVAQTLANMTPAQMQAAWLQVTRHILSHSEDVGQGFAAEARRIHHGEAAQRNIRGQASVEEAAELLDEGIDVLPLPIPEALKGPLQ